METRLCRKSDVELVLGESWRKKLATKQVGENIGYVTHSLNTGETF